MPPVEEPDQTYEEPDFEDEYEEGAEPSFASMLDEEGEGEETLQVDAAEVDDSLRVRSAHPADS